MEEGMTQLAGSEAMEELHHREKDGIAVSLGAATADALPRM
jgi:hypothetical protein